MLQYFSIRGVNKISRSKPLLVQHTVVTWLTFGVYRSDGNGPRRILLNLYL